MIGTPASTTSPAATIAARYARPVSARSASPPAAAPAAIAMLVTVRRIARADTRRGPSKARAMMAMRAALAADSATPTTAPIASTAQKSAAKA